MTLLVAFATIPESCFIHCIVKLLYRLKYIGWQVRLLALIVS